LLSEGEILVLMALGPQYCTADELMGVRHHRAPGTGCSGMKGGAERQAHDALRPRRAEKFEDSRIAWVAIRAVDPAGWVIMFANPLADSPVE
ncbi:MAG TPA: hypothetical protein PKN18_06790, partial [Pseudomonadales bacterium]|nr:hypothetical protein [Pseudomonadales bacterium]